MGSKVCIWLYLTITFRQWSLLGRYVGYTFLSLARSHRALALTVVFATDALDTGLVVFHSKKVPDSIFVLCHDDKFGNGVNSLVSVLIMTSRVYLKLEAIL